MNNTLQNMEEQSVGCITDWEVFHIANGTEEKTFNGMNKMLKNKNLPGIRK